MDDLRDDPLPADAGALPTDDDPDPAPERDEAPSIEDPRDRGGTGRPVGPNTIAEGRADGLMVPQGSTQGEGGGG
jgi:hypothetical protein